MEEEWYHEKRDAFIAEIGDTMQEVKREWKASQCRKLEGRGDRVNDFCGKQEK